MAYLDMYLYEFSNKIVHRINIIGLLPVPDTYQLIGNVINVICIVCLSRTYCVLYACNLCYFTRVMVPD